MNKPNKIPVTVIRRLCRYYRFLSELIDNGVTRISSKELSDKMGLTASQIRQDLNYFGGFGQQGYGYCVEHLKKEISNILGLSKEYGAILIGSGNLGQAVSTHMSFKKQGFNLIGVFDNKKSLIGKYINSLKIIDTENLEEFCKEHKPIMAVLCVPKQATHGLVKKLYGFGIKNYWNFSHYDLSVEYNDVIVENVHMSDSLMTLCYRISEQSENSENEKEL